MIEKYYDAWKIDLYMLAVVRFSDDERVPESLRDAVEEMIRGWDAEIESRIAVQDTDVDDICLESKS